MMRIFCNVSHFTYMKTTMNMCTQNILHTTDDKAVTSGGDSSGGGRTIFAWY